MYRSSRAPLHPSSDRAGFTLVELLVVIGIIVVLISLLLPTVGRIRAHGASTTCLSNLRQIGQLSLAYASENDGDLLPCLYDTIERLPGVSVQWVNKQLNNPSTVPDKSRYAAAVTIFFCPSNNLRAWEPGGFADGVDSGKMRYWYMGNPRNGNDNANPPPYDNSWADSRWLDVSPQPNGNGTKRDEYLRNVRDPRAAEIAIATDQSRQDAVGWYMLHGTGGTGDRSDPAKRVKNSWKNNLYGDGRVESIRPDAVIARWGPNNPAGW